LDFAERPYEPQPSPYFQPTSLCQHIEGVCQVREKSGNSLYLLKSQEKVREFSGRPVKSRGILVKPRNLSVGTAK